MPLILRIDEFLFDYTEGGVLLLIFLKKIRNPINFELKHLIIYPKIIRFYRIRSARIT